MKLAYRWWLLVGLLLGACLAMLMAYRFVSHQHGSVLHKKVAMAVVRMDEAIRLHPSHAEYEQALQELDALKAQYSAEQGSLNTKARLQALQLQEVSIDPAYIDSLNLELEARKAAKEAELEARLNAKRQALYKQFMPEVKQTPVEADLEIVNLQLALQNDERHSPMDPAQKEAFEADKAKKQERLEALLAARAPQANASREAVKSQVDEAMQADVAAAHAELEQYMTTVQAELLSKRDSHLQDKAKSIMTQANLPNADQWNASWQKRLSDKQAEVDALHEAIVDDIRMRVAVIAKSQGLDMVWTDSVHDIDALDITDAVTMSYGI